MLILAFESSARPASVALVRDGKLIAQSLQVSALTHSRTLLPMAEDLLKNTGVELSEIDAIADFLKMAPGEFVERYTRLTADRSGLSLIEKDDGSCVFLEASRPPACRIEAVKPRQCRDFPEKWNFPGWEKECAGGELA